MRNDRAMKVRAVRVPLAAAALMVLFTLLFLAIIQFLPSALRAEDASPSLEPIRSALPKGETLDGKVVYVDFWASWCPPCRQSFPWMTHLQEAHAAQGFEVVAVSLDRSRKPADEFLTELGSHVTIVYDSTGQLARQFGIDAMPTSFLFGRDGELRETHQGFHPEDTTEIDSTVESLLAAGSSE